MPPQPDPTIAVSVTTAAQRLEQDIIHYGFAFLALSFVSFIIVFLWRLRSGNEKVIGLAPMDLSKSSIGLTPEELRRIRQAQARHLEKMTQNAGPKPRPDHLIYDPEVLKLADVAAAKRQEEAMASQDIPNQPNRSSADPENQNMDPLPSDVLKMAELGLISPEELEAIRKRVLAKKQQIH
jgi:hypothetical protein